MKNPIFVEYYPHENCDCYKILNPWTEYRAHKIVLCPISEGIDKAKYLATVVINQKLQEALEEADHE